MKFSYPTAAALLAIGTCFSSCVELSDATTLGHKFFQTDVLLVNDTESTLITKLTMEETAHVDACNPDTKREEATVKVNEIGELSARMRCQYGPRVTLQVQSEEVLQDRKYAVVQLSGTYALEDLVIRDDMGPVENLVKIDEMHQMQLSWQDGDSITFADWSEQTIFISNQDLPSGPTTTIKIVADIKGSLHINDMALGNDLKVTVSDIPVINIVRTWRFEEKPRTKTFKFVCDLNECRDY